MVSLQQLHRCYPYKLKFVFANSWKLTVRNLYVFFLL
jgi:hypothetical protein